MSLSTTDTGGHITEFEMAAYADRMLGKADLERIEAHLADCQECRRELVEVTALSQSQRSRRFIRFAPLAAAAIIALAFLMRGAGSTDSQSGFRDPTLTLAAPPTLIAPLGAGERPTSLIWSAVPQVSLYRITIFNVDGERLWEEQVSDTLVHLPDSVRLSPNVDYFWKVAAQLDRDRWVSSELTAFNLPGSRSDH